MFYLLLFVGIIAFAIFLIIQGIKALKLKSGFNDLSNLCPFLCSVSEYREKDGKIVHGECKIEFNDNIFTIIQNNEQIENNIDSIYYFDIWEYKDETYFKIVMRSHIEYTFKSIRFEADKIAEILGTRGIKIEDNRKQQ